MGILENPEQCRDLRRLWVCASEFKGAEEEFAKNLEKQDCLMQIFDCDLHPLSLDMPLLGTGWYVEHQHLHYIHLDGSMPSFVSFCFLCVLDKSSPLMPFSLQLFSHPTGPMEMCGGMWEEEEKKYKITRRLHIILGNGSNASAFNIVQMLFSPANSLRMETPL